MDWITLLSVTFFAATVQAAIGFGFGLIAVSAFLIVLDSIAAIQLVMIITLAMSVVHWPKLRGIAPLNLLKWLSIGCTLGFPLGILIYQLLDLQIIKALVAVLIILICLQNSWYLISKKNAGCAPKISASAVPVISVGIVSGMMATSMAMPGPSVMLYLTRTSLTKNKIRATIVTFFLFSYAGALLLQSLLIGVQATTWQTAALLSPAALLGVFFGDKLAHNINQRYFTGAVLVILMLTGLFMLVNL